MGIYPVGIIPVRRESNPLIPTPSWLGNKDWQGFIYPNQLPKIYNPSKKFVASSNNKTSRNSPYYMSNYFEPSSRIERIYQIIQVQKEFSVRDVQLMQSDILSPYAQKMMQIVLPILESNINKFDNMRKQGLWVLKKWDYIFSPGAVAPSIYSSFFKNLIYETFVDELGEKLLWNYSYVTSIPSMKIYDMIVNGDTVFFDDIRTPWKEERNSIVLRSYLKAINELYQYFNDSNIFNWKFSKLQTLELNHTFSKNSFLKPSVNSGPYQIGGNFTTISKADWKIYNPYKITVGVSGRFIADMEDSVIYSSLPGGASGDPVSPNYNDQILLFLNSGYVKINSKREPTTDYKLGIEFLPKR
jgi:penicillin amidase